MKYKLTVTYRKEKEQEAFTSKNRGFFFRVKKKWEKANLEEEVCQVSLDCIKVSRLFWNVQQVPSSFFIFGCL